jgi:hypothetical protein
VMKCHPRVSCGNGLIIDREITVGVALPVA